MQIGKKETDLDPEPMRTRGFGDVPFPMARKTRALREEDSYMEECGKEWCRLGELAHPPWTVVKAWIQTTRKWVSDRRNKARSTGSYSDSRKDY